jgi:ribose/xylose/arabinose/galactoside ABC-type transport system permease subunit
MPAISLTYLPLLVTVSLFALMFGLGSAFYDGFGSLQVFLNLFIDNAFLCIAAIGMTFVIISGGIDLSVGSVVALTTMVSAALVKQHHVNPIAVIALVLAMGAGFGCAMGCLIRFFELAPFIVTLAGMFLARGLCYLISINSISIADPLYTEVSRYRIPLAGDSAISVGVVVALLVLAGAVFVAHFTKFGRTMYAIGGSEHSAMLMGLPVGRVKIPIYTFSGFCSGRRVTRSGRFPDRSTGGVASPLDGPPGFLHHRGAMLVLGRAALLLLVAATLVVAGVPPTLDEDRSVPGFCSPDCPLQQDAAHSGAVAPPPSRHDCSAAPTRERPQAAPPLAVLIVPASPDAPRAPPQA